ncbi:DUF6944 family repetitive protein [Peribacillus sp. NPDC097895]|uniref:DUF6944 family repetitive protein n=1 Tax=Peribacillus sp. NPDC097895 TaxID=3390619 RepID=UPI003D091842
MPYKQKGKGKSFITGQVIDFKKETKQKIFNTGNWMQALSGLINVGHGIELNPFPGHSENMIGNLVQSMGDSLQAIGGVSEYGNQYEVYREHNYGESLVVTGSWIQAIGSVISVIGTIKEETQGIQIESQLRFYVAFIHL